MEDSVFLVRRFRQIAPQLITRWDAVQARRLRTWLKDDVLPVLEEYVKRPRFRNYAAWSIRALHSGAGTTERKLVEKVDKAIVDYGRLLLELMRRPRLRLRLAAVAGADTIVSNELEIGADQVRVAARKKCSVNRIDRLTPQVESIAGRFWRDLVCVEDFFEPVGGWMEKGAPAGQAGEFVTSLNPELHAGGDFVSRCMWRRVELLHATLTEAREVCVRTLPSRGRHPAGWQEADRCFQRLTTLTKKLQHACLENEQQFLRDACVLLTQVYVGLRPEPEVGWLDFPEAAVHRGNAVMAYKLFNAGQGELFERLAAALGALPRLYAGADPQQTAIEEAVATGGLVVLSSARQVYWEGKSLQVKWSRYPSTWRFFVTLVKKARNGAAVDWSDLYEYVVADSTLATTFSRFKHLVPASLWKHVVSAAARCYRLDLEPQRLFLFGGPRDLPAVL